MHHAGTINIAAIALTTSMKLSSTAASDWKRRSDRKIQLTTPATSVAAVNDTAYPVVATALTTACAMSRVSAISSRIRSMKYTA